LAHREQQREDRAWRRWQKRAEIKARTLRALIASSCIALIGWWIYALVTASIVTRPRIAAIGMIVAISPSLIATFPDRTFRSIFLSAAAGGVLALLLAGSPSHPGYAFAAVMLAGLYVLAVGSFAVMFGMFSGFSANERDMRQVWLIFVLPGLLSSIAAVLYAVTAVRAAHTHGLSARTVRTTGIVVSVLLLFAALRSRTSRSARGVLVPLALIWLVVWIFGGLR
jgi:hypothetical protein